MWMRSACGRPALSFTLPAVSLLAPTPASPSPAARLERVSVTYEDTSTPALVDLSLAIRPGEIHALVGESGSGKSTAGLAAIGLLPGEAVGVEGQIILGDQALPADSPDKFAPLRGREVGMIFQEPGTALHPAMRIGSQVAEAIHGGALGRGERRKRVAELLRSVQLAPAAGLLRAFPHHLSGGMQQRVLIAMAMANQPLLLVADEPTTALDPTTQREILDLLRSLARTRGTGVLLITHDLGIVHHYADELTVLRDGRTLEQGRTAEVLRAPAHPYTRELLAALPRPAFAAATVEEGGGLA